MGLFYSTNGTAAKTHGYDSNMGLQLVDYPRDRFDISAGYMWLPGSAVIYQLDKDNNTGPAINIVSLTPLAGYGSYTTVRRVRRDDSAFYCHVSNGSNVIILRYTLAGVATHAITGYGMINENGYCLDTEYLYSVEGNDPTLIHKFNKVDLTFVGTFDTGIYYAYAIAVDSDYLYATNYNGYVYRLSKTTGATLLSNKFSSYAGSKNLSLNSTSIFVDTATAIGTGTYSRWKINKSTLVASAESHSPSAINDRSGVYEDSYAILFLHPSNLQYTFGAGIPFITLTWDFSASGYDGFAILRSLDGVAYLPIDYVPLEDRSYVTYAPVNGGEYYWFKVALYTGDEVGEAESNVVTMSNSPHVGTGTPYGSRKYADGMHWGEGTCLFTSESASTVTVSSEASTTVTFTAETPTTIGYTNE